MHKSKYLSRICATILVVCLFGSLLVTASATQVNPFEDVKTADYFYDAVLWAVDQNITKGVGDGKFAPLKTCTRAEAVTFLWRAMGEPTPTSTSCKFTDVEKNAYYYTAVLWAVEENITTGTSATTFAPNMTLTREQFVTLLWRTAGEPNVTAKVTFTDVASGVYYEKAVQWAVEEKITEGVGNNMFGPRRDCTRSQIVTLLMRYSESNSAPDEPSTPQEPVFPITPQDPVVPDEPNEPDEPNNPDKPNDGSSTGIGGKYETSWA